MNTRLRARIPAILVTAIAMAALLGAQIPGTIGADRTGTTEQDARLPSGKLQRDEILKAEHEQNLKDAAKLIELSEELKQDLEKNDRFVLSMATLKKTDEIEKLAKKIRSRLRHD